jgi:hypothetical protein
LLTSVATLATLPLPHAPLLVLVLLPLLLLLPDGTKSCLGPTGEVPLGDKQAAVAVLL